MSVCHMDIVHEVDVDSSSGVDSNSRFVIGGTTISGSFIENRTVNNVTSEVDDLVSPLPSYGGGGGGGKGRGGGNGSPYHRSSPSYKASSPLNKASNKSSSSSLLPPPLFTSMNSGGGDGGRSSTSPSSLERDDSKMNDFINSPSYFLTQDYTPRMRRDTIDSEVSDITCSTTGRMSPERLSLSERGGGGGGGSITPRASSFRLSKSSSAKMLLYNTLTTKKSSTTTATTATTTGTNGTPTSTSSSVNESDSPQDEGKGKKGNNSGSSGGGGGSYQLQLDILNEFESEENKRISQDIEARGNQENVRISQQIGKERSSQQLAEMQSSSSSSSQHQQYDTVDDTVEPNKEANVTTLLEPSSNLDYSFVTTDKMITNNKPPTGQVEFKNDNDDDSSDGVQPEQQQPQPQSSLSVDAAAKSESKEREEVSKMAEQSDGLAVAAEAGETNVSNEQDEDQAESPDNASVHYSVTMRDFHGDWKQKGECDNIERFLTILNKPWGMR
jgi:hypothetical protein